MKRSVDGTRREDRDLTGLCDEAQADGVPCYEAGRQCETCARARPEAAAPAPTRVPGKPSTKKRR
jgi:hypothetical protein